MKEERTVYTECEGTSFFHNTVNCLSSAHQNSPKDLNLDVKVFICGSKKTFTCNNYICHTKYSANIDTEYG